MILPMILIASGMTAWIAPAGPGVVKRCGGHKKRQSLDEALPISAHTRL
jgi:hypothetical protein